MRLAAWARGLVVAVLITSGCGGSGGDGMTDEATVPTPSVALTDAQAVESGAGAALTFIAALRTLAGDAPATSTAATAMAAGPAGISAGQCLNGGVLVASCRTEDGIATLTSRAQECELLDLASGYHVTFNGELRIEIAAPDVCRSGVIPNEVPRTYRYRNFQAVMRDGNRVVETFDAARLTERVTPRSGGCAGGDHDARLDGRVQISRDGGTVVRIDTTGLRLARRFDGTPCTGRVVADGVATFTDAAGGRTVRAALHELALSGDGRLSGDADLACAGRFGFDVETDDAATCPSGGGVLQLPSGTAAGADFAAGGVSLDADGDGVAERTVESCRALVTAGCG